MRLYRAIKKVCQEENLEALTLSCFKLIEQIDTTGCLALSLLNDDGIMAGCEGDLQSIFTLLSREVTDGKDGFMANPSMINTRTNELILAHCTIGLKQTERYIIRNHFETEKGIAIPGIAPDRRRDYHKVRRRMSGRVLPVYRDTDPKIRIISICAGHKRAYG